MKLLNKIPYFINHLLIALLIDLASYFIFGQCTLLGFIFYLGREIRDLEKLHGWDIKGMDWEGLLYPLGGSLLMLIL